jgi:hypothetical protein
LSRRRKVEHGKTLRRRKSREVCRGTLRQREQLDTWTVHIKCKNVRKRTERGKRLGNEPHKVVMSKQSG